MPAQRLRLAVGCGQVDTLGLYHSSTLYQLCGTLEALFTPQACLLICELGVVNTCRHCDPSFLETSSVPVR